MSVYVTRLYEFACDEPGCDVVSEQVSPSTEAGRCRDAWTIVERDGWRRRGSQHYCADHVDYA